MQTYIWAIPQYPIAKMDKEPLVTGKDGRVVLEIIYAAYASAAHGKKIMLPFTPEVAKPIDLWLGNSE